MQIRIFSNQSTDVTEHILGVEEKMSGLRNYVMIIASIVIFASIIVETNADPIVPFLEVEPNGIESELFTGELEEHIINIYNSGDNAVEFSVSHNVISIPERDNRKRRISRKSENRLSGPSRDDIENLIQEYEIPYDGVRGLAWDDHNNLLWAIILDTWTIIPRLIAFNPETSEIEFDIQIDDYYTGMFFLDGILHAGGEAREIIFRIDTDGNLIRALETPVDMQNNPIATDGENIRVFNLLELEEVAAINVQDIVQPGCIIAIEWVPEHNGGQLWIAHGNEISQCYVNDDWSVEEVSSIRARFGWRGGLAHDGENMWYAVDQRDSNWWMFDDEVDESSKWVSYQPASGEIESDDDVDIVVTIDAEELIEGVYESEIMINSNDPDNPEVAVFVSLNVNSAPIIRPTWLRDYGYPDVVNWNRSYEDLFTENQYSIQLQIRNEGTDALHIDDIFCEDELFTPEYNEDVLDTGEGMAVVLTLLGDEVGLYEDNLVIISNSLENEELYIPLVGEVFDPPVILTDVDLVEDDLYTGANQNYPVTVFNDGSADLRFTASTQVFSEPEVDGKKRRMREITGTSEPVRDERVPGYLGEYYAGENLMALVTTRIDSVIDFNWNNQSPAEGVPEDHFSVRWSGNFYVEEEGMYFIRTITDDGHRLILDDEIVVDVFDRDVDPFENRNIRSTVNLDLENGFHTIILEMRNDRMGSEAHLFWRSSEANRFSLLPGSQGSDWIFVEPKSGIVAAGDDQELLVNVNCDGLVGGDYEAGIIINSNDPEIPETIIDFVVHVEAAANIDVSWTEEIGFPDVMDWNSAYEELFCGGPYQVPVTIRNTGSSDLEIGQIESESRLFYSIPDQLTIGSRDEAEVHFIFDTEREEAGEYQESMILHSNDPDNEFIEILLRADAGQPPIMIIDSDGIEERLRISETSEHQINIHNDGEASLRFSITREIISEPERDLPQRSPRNISVVVESGPNRDLPGDIIEWYDIPYNGTKGLAFDKENNWLWAVNFRDPAILYSMNPENGEIINDFQVEEGIFGLFIQDGIIHAGGTFWGGNEIVRYDAEGNLLQPINIPDEYCNTRIVSNGQYFFMNEQDTLMRGGNHIHVLDSETLEEVAIMDYMDGLNETFVYSVEWVPEHINGHLWLCGEHAMYQFSIDEEWNCELINQIDMRGSSFCGLTHDGENFYRTSGSSIKILDDGIDEVAWLRCQPMSGELESGEDCDLTIHIDATYLTDGLYEGELNLHSNDPANTSFIINISLEVGLWPRHFVDYRESAFVHQLDVTELVFDDLPAAGEWEIGVYSPDGELSGAIVFSEGEISELSAFGLVEDGGQFTQGDRMSFRVWNSETDKEYPATARFEDGPAIWINSSASIITLEAHTSREIRVSMQQGWNMISINVIPDDSELWDREEGPNVPRMLQQLRVDLDNHHVQLFKNGYGDFYAPTWGFNNIPYWDLSEGYKAKVDENVEAAWIGRPIPADTEIELNPGWSMVAYYPTVENDASSPEFEVLSSVIDDVVIAKDGFGNFMAPRHDFSNMASWSQGYGYQIKIDSEECVNLRYQDGNEEGRVASVKEYTNCNNYWSQPRSTGENMSLLIEPDVGSKFADGDQIAAISEDGRLVGLGVVHDRRSGLAIWGDDESTEIAEGLVEGECFDLRHWVRDLGVVRHLSIESGKDLSYEADGFISLKVASDSNIPEEYYLSGGYPNPFNSTTRLSYGLPVSGNLRVNVYDLAGRLVTTLIDGEHSAGRFEVIWDSKTASAGTYLIRLQSDSFNSVSKVTLVK